MSAVISDTTIMVALDALYDSRGHWRWAWRIMPSEQVENMLLSIERAIEELQNGLAGKVEL